MNVDPYVQEWVAGTNGKLYRPLVNKLRRYPIPDCPLPPATGQLLLDIGCGWGRWMVSASRKGYVPIGIDIKLDALRAARRVLRAHGMEGYVVAADLKRLPFRSGIFDAVFSYSTIQHAHRQRAQSCVEEVHRVLATGGLSMIEFPTKYGIGNLLRGRSRRRAEADDTESWCVRYYSIAELEALFTRVFGDFSYTVDCYLGIGVQPSDLQMLPWRYKGIVTCSELLKLLSRWVGLVRKVADSIYVVATKTGGADAAPSGGRGFRGLQGTGVASKGDNLTILDLLACPATGAPLTLEVGRSRLISRTAGMAYPVVDGIPVLVLEEARSL